MASNNQELVRIENQEWLHSLEYVLHSEGKERVRQLLNLLHQRAREYGIKDAASLSTPYTNTIPPDKEEDFPGDMEMEIKLESLIRWNAMAMVVKANKTTEGIGGHISTYASAATLFEVGFNHFFRAGKQPDFVYFQGHAAPGVYARSFLEHRFSEEQLEYFRRELRGKKGLPSYPHPRLMPDYWRFPTVSMGLAAIQAIYQARFNKYLENRSLIENGQKVWAMLGDGEMDEPESLGAINIATRENLDNLIFVINCNLQRLDGPVRSNNNIIHELETTFTGSGWRVIKVLWSRHWDKIFQKDTSGKLARHLGDLVDGELQKLSVADGKTLRKELFSENGLSELVEDLNDEDLEDLKRGGHDFPKVYNAFRMASQTDGRPTVILAQTIKGYGLGEAGEASNVTHKAKKLNEEQLKAFRDRFDIPVKDEDIADIPFIRPKEDSQEVKYLKARRKELNGIFPIRKTLAEALNPPDESIFDSFSEGSYDKDVTTTSVMVQIISKLLKDENVGDYIIPIIPDESRTFGMDALFTQVGIYAAEGQQYEPIDKGNILYYKEDEEGVLLEEGITEAGAMSSFIASGTAHVSYPIHTIPFFAFYSMFGFQRVGDLIWAFGDLRGRGFLLGATSGRTTLNGEGLQHEDGHSHVLASTIPNVLTYDPTFAYEIAVIVQEGIRRMYHEHEDIFYYITLGNENYPMAPLRKGVEEGILKGLYKFQEGKKVKGKKQVKAHIFGSGSILREAMRAQEILAEKYNVSADVWSATSYKELRRDALEVERWNLLHPTSKQKKPYVTELLEKEEGPVVAASDYMKIVPEQIARWVPGGLYPLGTDGFGRSDSREALRRFFEVDAESIVIATLSQLSKKEKFKAADVKKAITDLGIDAEKPNPVTS